MLRARADAGDGYAARHLAALLAESGDLAQAEYVLHAQVDAGDQSAAEQVADLLTGQGRDEEAKGLRQFGLNPDGSIGWARRNDVP